MTSVTPCLWFETQAEEAARFYVSLLEDSRIDGVMRAPGDYPGGVQGAVLLVQFTLAGRAFQALNGGLHDRFNDSVSMSISVEGQAEVDRLWAALTAEGGEGRQCGWLRDRWGLSWQVVPTALPRLLGSPDRAAAGRAMQAMMEMGKIDVAVMERAARG